MFTKYILPLMAAVGLGFAVIMVLQGQKVTPPTRPAASPPTKPDGPPTIAGAGIIEANLENIPIGANIPGVVTEVYVKVNEPVGIGTPLFKTDDRNLEAELRVREANLKAATAQLARIEAAPQAQDIPTAQAAVDEARAKFREAEITYTRTSQLYGRQVAPQSDYDRDRHALDAARAGLARAEADLKRIKLTWEKDIQVARAQCDQAKSQLESTRTDIERCTVKAMAEGQVLQVNVRPGQYAAAIWKDPLVVLGDVKTLNVRVDIDEQDVPYFDPKAEAFATLKGRPSFVFPLTKIVKVEPYVIPKRSLTGDNSERVDTRVLQVVYALPEYRELPLYVGQQMDVYLRAATLSADQERRLKAGPGVKKPFEEAVPRTASAEEAKGGAKKPFAE